ncbi:hypothetical protein ElyMa_005233900 [Elysia marginata]|uniref:PiggyBac transposable element-derived protein domain-containing protein n=1 Tax=Elysia marginata TaxID=1093978 RepID=A0AAV4K1E0_9GAST|nr:hypothetical protein ElyMa_005233900 [Elysia marginata]
MASRRMFTAAEVLESFFTPGSEDEDDGEIERIEEDEEGDNDVPCRSGNIEQEAAQSESSFNSTRSSTCRSNTVSPEDEDVDLNPNLPYGEESDSDMSDDAREKLEVEENAHLYDVETKEEADADPDQDLAEENRGWQKNTQGFPRVTRFTGVPGIKVPIPDDPQPLDIYKLFITDELIRSWKVSFNTISLFRSRSTKI